jgi:hypothetical protein
MALYAELYANGQFGEASYNLLFELTRQELRLFPGLRPATADRDAVWDFVGDFLVDRGSGVTTMLLATASDDEGVIRLLRTSLRRWLVDQVRKTARGTLRRRLTRLISEDERFEVVPEGQVGADRWRLAGSAGLPTGPPLAELRVAAWEVADVRVPPWTSEKRRPPAADGPSLCRIMLAVLARAGGSLEPETVVTVFADRLPHALDPAEEPLTDAAADWIAGPDTGDPARVVVDGEHASDAARSARDFYDQMSAEERRLLPHLNGRIAEQMRATRRGKSQTSLRVRALGERLRALLGVEEERGLVAGELLRLCSDRAGRAPDSRRDVPSVSGSR